MLPIVPSHMDFLVGGYFFIVLSLAIPPVFNHLTTSSARFSFLRSLIAHLHLTQYVSFSAFLLYGVLGLPEPSSICDSEFAASRNICEPLCDFICTLSLSFAEVSSSQLNRKSLIHKSKAEGYSALSLCENFEPSLQSAIDFASVKGASSWLIALPLLEYGFSLHKSAFQDALALHYNWSPLMAPSLCACGSSFSVEHVLGWTSYFETQ